MNTAVIDLFCGVGGLSHGFFMEGFPIVAGIDSDETCQLAFEKNNKAVFIQSDIRKLSSEKIKALYPKDSIKILIGCAPCQPFSRYTSGTKNKQEQNKWELLNFFSNLINDIQPDIISMENVPQLSNIDKYKVYSNFIQNLINNQYHVSNPKKIVYCPDYGIPQSRKRLVLLASKFGTIDLLPPTHTKKQYKTVKDAIGHLPPIEDGIISDYNQLHRAQKLSNLNKLRIQKIKQGESWRNLPIELVSACHKKLSGKTFGDVYGRMKWNEPSPTMTTHCTGFGNGRFGHPEQDRAISLLEAAIFQTFPENYFDEIGYTYANLQKHIGNAVPVLLGQVIAKSIKHHLNSLANHAK